MQKDTCAICHSDIVKHTGRWRHVHPDSSVLSRNVDTSPDERDNDHDPQPTRWAAG